MKMTLTEVIDSIYFDQCILWMEEEIDNSITNQLKFENFY
jgi:hypothetical protein